MRSYTRDRSITSQRLKPGSVRRIVSYARPYRGSLALFLVATVLDAVRHGGRAAAAEGDHRRGHPGEGHRAGGRPGRRWPPGWPCLDALLSLAQRWLSSRIGEGLIYRPALAGVRARAAAADRLLHPGADRVAGQPAEQRRDRRPAGADLDAVRGGVQPVSLVLVLVAMFLLSWPVTLISLALAPLFIMPGAADGPPPAAADPRVDAAGRPDGLHHDRAVQRGRRDAGQAVRPARARRPRCSPAGPRGSATSAWSPPSTAARCSSRSPCWPRWPPRRCTGSAAAWSSTARIQLGTLVALTLLLGRLYGPITALSNVQVDVMTALVSFDRVFEVLDLKPLIEDRPGAPRRWPAPVRAGARAGHRVRPRVVPLPDRQRGVAGLAGVHRAARCPSARRAARTCCTTSPSPPRPGSSPRWSARRARARRPSPTWSPGCMTRCPARSGSAAPTCATSPRSRCTTRSAWSPRTRTCSTTRSGPTCCTPGRGRPSRS